MKFNEVIVKERKVCRIYESYFLITVPEKSLLSRMSTSSDKTNLMTFLAENFIVSVREIMKHYF